MSLGTGELYLASHPQDESRLKSAGILLISAAFPPAAEAGTARMLRFTRWLSEWGWRFRVVTMDPLPGRSDLNLMAHLPEEIRIRSSAAVYPLRTAAKWRNRLRPRANGQATGNAPAAKSPGPPSRLQDLAFAAFATPDTEIGWFPSALRNGLRLCSPDRPAWIISSGPPHTAHLVARVLKLATGVRWLADLRDPWASGAWNRTGTSGPLARGLNLREERGMVRNADAIVLNTDALLGSFRERYPQFADKMSSIPNGYDGTLASSPCLTVNRGRPIRILHAGALYSQRSPAAALQALAELIISGEAAHDSVEFVFLGSASEDLDLPGMVARLGLQNCVRILPSVSKQEAIELMRQADMLLLIQPQAPLQIPSKVFDYLTVGKPVLALLDVGAAADLVRRSRIGLIAAPNDVEQIKGLLLRLIQRDYVTTPDWDYLSRFSGESLSRQLEQRLLSPR